MDNRKPIFTLILLRVRFILVHMPIPPPHKNISAYSTQLSTLIYLIVSKTNSSYFLMGLEE